MQIEQAAFEELYASYGRDVFRFALYLCGDAARAEDLTSETFLRVWTSPIPLRLPTVKAYLLAITRNLVAQEARRGRTAAQPLDENMPGAGSLERQTQARSELAAVRQAVARLPADTREALILRSQAGMSYDEIAAVLQISAVSARVKVHRARVELARWLKGPKKESDK